jgi:archaellum component FlaG (FlaF/FlaG flagellin family)
MDKTITTALLIVISMIMVVLLFNAAYPAILQGSDAITNMTDRAEERMKTEISVIHAAGELDADGFWANTNGNSSFEVFVWVKNVGSTRLTAVEQSDVFFGREGNFARIPYSAGGGSYPYWSWELENATAWTPTATLKITIHYGVPQSPGRYFIKVILPSGVSSDYFLGM